MKRVLIVDDEPEIVHLLCSFLRKRDYDLITAANGNEAIERVKADHPQVVLLDINMPGKNGLQVLEEIREFDPRIGVIMVTAQSDEDTGRAALSKGAFDYITKPFDFEYLQKV